MQRQPIRKGYVCHRGDTQSTGDKDITKTYSNLESLDANDNSLRNVHICLVMNMNIKYYFPVKTQ